ncbi:MAG TPA: MgtC/SapB family protein [Burkholderiales bacterium]|nr:MgtC/SapB family protein [Burkholderiales bacterium]
MLEKVVETLREEFSDLADASDVTRLLLRVLLAVGLAALIGYEREVRGSTAGLRTHMIIALGVALIVVAAQQSGMDSEDVSRVIQGVFAGIGFLGAGAIIKQSRSEEVRGLTTAASLWTTAAVATACGLGSELTAITATLIALLILSVLLRIERRTIKRNPPPP